MFTMRLKSNVGSKYTPTKLAIGDRIIFDLQDGSFHIERRDMYIIPNLLSIGFGPLLHDFHFTGVVTSVMTGAAGYNHRCVDRGDRYVTYEVIAQNVELVV